MAERWVKVLDQSRCIGCHACTIACKSENEVPLGVTRTYVKSVDVGIFPQVRRAFQVTRCNQCENPPCVTACPTSAMYRRPDGIVDFDKSICIGCKACMAACPYDAIFINPEDHSAEKCNFCAHRLEVGLEPACVVVCPTEAILVGDLRDPTSKVASMVERQAVTVRRPEKETAPKVFYKGAHAATLDPIAARRPGGDTYMWSQVPRGAHVVASGHPGPHANSSAAALLSYDVAHSAPWGWPVSLYTWTKGIAAGAYLVPLLLALGGVLPWTSPVLALAGPLVALAFLGFTGAILISDLEHPARFYLLFTRPQWRSWLVRGGFVIAAYGGVLVAQLILGGAFSSVIGEKVVAAFGLPASVMTAVYTAFLFAQAKARDLWQSPLLPPHLAVQAILAGSGTMVVVAAGIGGAGGGAPVTSALAYVLAGACLVHLVMVAGEVTLPHPTAHAALAVQEMTRGARARIWWAGLALVAVGIFAPAIGWPAGLVALAGLGAHEHAYVQAGQSVPLA